MNIKKGFVIQEVGGQWVAVATGAAAAEFSGIVKLNDTAAIVWRGDRGWVCHATRSLRAWLSRTMWTSRARPPMSTPSCRRL